MKISLNNIYTLDRIFNKVSETSGKVGYAIYKNKKIIASGMNEIYQYRDNLIKKYGKQDQSEEGRYVISKDEENYDKFINDMVLELNKIDDFDLYQINPEDWEGFYNENLQTEEYELLEAAIVKLELPEEVVPTF